MYFLFICCSYSIIERCHNFFNELFPEEVYDILFTFLAPKDIEGDILDYLRNRNCNLLRTSDGVRYEEYFEDSSELIQHYNDFLEQNNISLMTNVNISIIVIFC